MKTSPAMEPTVIDTALAEALAAQYPSMLSLDLRSNNIVSLQDLRPLSGLGELALDDNRLETLEGLADLRVLTSLSARSNIISDVGGRVTALSSLRVLDLAWNRLAAGPWVHVLATLPHLTELDLRGNPVCDLEGSQQLLAAALPRLQRLNGTWLHHAEAGGGSPGPMYPSPTDAAPNLQQRPYGEQPTEQAARGPRFAGGTAGPGQAGQQLAADGGWYDPQAALPVNAAAPPGDTGGGVGEGASAAHRLFINSADRPQWESNNNTQPWAAQLAPPPAPQVKLPQQQQQRFQQGEPWALGSELGWWRPAVGAQQSEEVGATELRAQLEEPGQVHRALAEVHAGLVGERERLLQRTVSLEGALRQAEDANSRLQQQLLQQQSAASAQQVAALASQVAALLADRDAAASQAEQLGSRLADAEGRADEAARAAGGAAAQAEQLRDVERQLRRELVATQELLLQQQQRSSAAQAGATGAVGGAAAGQAPSGCPSGQGGSPGSASPRGGRGGGGGGGSSRVEAALQQRVEALQRVVRMQERELVRLGGLVAIQDAAGGAAPGAAAPPSGPAGAGAGWDVVLQPWREQVQALHEQVARMGAEGQEQRAEWGQQLAEMREQFMQARTLLEVLEQRSREQRSENSQLHARLSQLGAELTEERQRAAGLKQQLAARDAAAQAVRRQLLSFKSHMEQREAALEGRAEQLSAHAARLSYASRRLGFALSLAALRGRGQGPALAQGRGGPRHVALQGMLAASPAAKMATAASSGWTPWSPDYGSGPSLGLGLVTGGVGSGGGGADGAAQGQADEAPLVAVLRRELANLARDRDMLLQQLAQVSSAAEERIRQAQAAMQEREARHREALVAARVQAAVHAAEAEADRKVQAAEAASEAQAAQVRTQVAAALEASEELCRRTEAAAGMRLSKAVVRLADLDKQVARLRSARQRAADELRSAGLQLERLRHEVAASRASEADLRSQLASRDREAHARVAELRAEREEALEAERRRAAEAERLAAKAAAENGQLERQLARTREVKAQQEDARLRRLQSQVHEQEAQLRTLRRERNTLLAELRKLQQGGDRGARQLGGDLTDGHTDTETATVGDRGTEGLEEESMARTGVALSAAALDTFGSSERAARGRTAGAAAEPLPALLAQRGTRGSEGGSAGLSIRSILRSGLPHGGAAAAAAGDRSSEHAAVAAAQRGVRAPVSTIGLGVVAAEGAGDTRGQAGIGSVPSAAAGTAAPVELLRGGTRSDPLAERLSELEALTAELLSA